MMKTREILVLALLAAFPGPVDGSMSDLDITVGGDVAYGHSIQHASLTAKDGKKLEVTVRVTDGYKKINGPVADQP